MCTVTATNMAAVRVLAVIATLFLCYFGATVGQGDGFVVSTATGQVRGTATHTTDLPDKPIYTFLGIPYAAPPVGELRYRPPQPALPWEGVREAVEYGSYCRQNLTAFKEMDHDLPILFGEDMTMSEDCLTVNVFTPTVAGDAALPVMMWIHGGALTIGFGGPPGWEVLAAHQDVVVVSINYRLGVLGFLSTGDENMPGNYGLLDQVRAMEWVQENIRSFGGDPERVTIFGESAGGISISYHLLSPLSKGLFQRAISQSGTWKTFPYNPQPLAITKMIAEKAGCDAEDTATIATCLKEKSAEKLLEAFEATGVPYLVPVVDGTFLTTDPMDLMEKGDINTADYLLGVNNHEMGWLGLTQFIQGDPRVGITQEEFVNLVRSGTSMVFQGNPNLDKIVDTIVAEYRDPTTPDDPLAIINQYSHLNGDALFIGPTMLAAEKHADAGARVFLYENQYRPSIHPNRPDWVGSDHGDDLFIIFGFAFLEGVNQTYSKEDEEFTLIMMAYWANFARTGDPSDSTGGPTDSPSLPTWPQYTPDNPVYMKLDVVPTTDVDLKPDKVKLWNEVIPGLAAETGQNDGLVVSTVTGQVRGTTTHTTDLPYKPIYAFRGIPYAAPPVGELRYRPPQPALPWEGVREAVDYGSYCPQNLSGLNQLDFPMEFGENMTMSEDCLTVNVYTPTVAADAALPVLLWIHGGGLMVFYGSPPGWEALAAHQDVVVVSFNYRLGVLGFLSTGDENMPGNYGLLDQVHAMKWVKENIRSFGGDPERVTIFGESAGAISVSYLLLSPLSKGLFQRAISQSGTWKTFPVNPQPLATTKMFAEKAGCEMEDPAALTTCLKEKSAEELMEAVQALGPMFYLVPVVDGTFLTAHPTDLMEKGEINTADYLVGFNNHEGGWMGLSSFLEGDPHDGISQEEFVKLVKMILSFVYPGNPNFDKIADTIVAEYQHPTTPDNPLATLNQFTHVTGDSFFIAPTMLVTEKHVNAGARVFLYEDQYRPSIHKNKPDWVGCEHGDDLFMLWGIPFLDGPVKPLNYTKEDEQFSLDMMAYWANFARTGDPSDSTGGPTDSPSLPTWPQYTPDNPVYMKLDVVSTTEVGMKPDKVKLWNEIIPDLAAAGNAECPVVSTETGQVKGTVLHATDLPTKPVYTYLGIPYAAPPVGELRYRPPQPALPWEGVRDAVEPGFYCPQNLTYLNSMDLPYKLGENMTMSEDCLTLTVFTPTVAADAALPVLFWIHGGGLSMGMGSINGYEALVAHQDVVLVSINYRLGVLGFLSTGDENIPGNYGFLDQVRAMEWVKDNIRNFGGDPERVTIFGESAGAVSVSYQLLSPLSKGLFQRAISQSGTWTTMPVNPQPLPLTKMFAEEAGCETEDTATMTTCLKEKSPQDLLESFQALQLKMGPMYFSPVVDGTFLTSQPMDLMEKGEINTADYLLGVSNHEFGWLMLPFAIQGDPLAGISQEDFVRLTKTAASMVYRDNPNMDKMVDAMVAEYSAKSDDPMAIQYQFSHLYGDFLFVAPTIMVADKHAGAGARVLLYENQYRPSIYPNRPDWVGCDHGDDIFMVMGIPFFDDQGATNITYSKTDENVSLSLMACWANFARTGDPSDSTGGPTDSPSLPTWPQYTPDNPVYMKLDVVSTTEVGMKPDKVKLWNEIIPDLAAAGNAECPVVSTETGQVKGTVLHATDLPTKPVYTYLGIPYAAPPVGELRYRPPQPALPWEGVRDAVEPGFYCPQNLTYLNSMDLPYKLGENMTMSEDCLTLTVFTPTVAADAALPVLFWIHGGGLSMGMGSINGYEALVAHQDVVLVSINYRLGVLGFLSTGDENIPGNYGFLDQVRAMEWVKENIRNFGGDPERVTLFGQSAGGISISYHLLSPLSKGFFQRAISQSGTWKTFPVNPQPLPLTKMFAEKAGCEMEDTASITACLKGKSAEELLESLWPMLYLVPVVDGTFLTTDPMDLMEKGDINTADYLLGVNNHEVGWVALSHFVQGDLHVGISQEEVVKIVRTGTTMAYQGNPNLDKMVDTIVAEYRNPTTPDDPLAIQYQFSHMKGDSMFVAPTMLVAEKHADVGARVFLYENQYRPSIHPNRPDWVGCAHADDLFIIWGLPFLKGPVKPVNYSDEDEEFSLIMMAYWANFARTGDPSDSTGGPTDSPSLPTWPQYTPDNPVYMKLDVVSTTEVGMKPDKVKLWNEIIPDLAAAGNAECPVVSTETGQVKGTVLHATDLPTKPVYTYLGIPYAAPPVGELRYRPPQPALPWEGVRDAVEPGFYCLQNLTYLNSMDLPYKLGENMTMSEDCLTLTVFTPTVAADAALPVLLWIHGGGLSMGMGSINGYEALVAHQDVVLVSINYRLGVLGFLSTGDENIPGNYGFLDQVRAMEWVKDNIRNFGGDPGRVTIFGESAGAVSVSYQLLSPLSKGLFQRAISQSGIWTTIPVNPQPLPLTKMFAEEAGCETEDTAAMTTCLKGKSPEDLLESFQALQPKIGPMYFSPVVDGTFLTSQPMDLMDKGEINTADYLLGVSNHEFGWLVLPFAIQGDPLAGISQEDFVRLTKTAASMVYRDNPNMDKMVDAMVTEYSAKSDDPMAIQYQFSHLCGDFLFVAPTVMVADKHAGAGARVLLYENQYRPSIYPNRPDWVGCDHGDDIFMVMGIPFFDDQGATNITYSKTDEHVSLSMMAYWANFARTGDPSDSTGGPTDSPSLPTWPQYTPDNPVYMKLDVVSTTEVGMKPDKVKLWNEIIPDLAAAGNAECPVVSTETGQVKGTVLHATDLPTKPVYTYLGIPYAAPPVGELRYRPPQPALPWEGVRDTVEPGLYCPQNLTYLNSMDLPYKLGENMTMSEDCLTLTVFTPTVAADAALPVLFWIHGGGLSMGMGSINGYEALVAHQDVVLVSINYRLGVLGFLSTGDENIPGNYGFLDQVRAMEWVKDNIRNFGGDPGRVTIFGESAGAVSVSYQLLSPLSKGLFQRAISQSGTWTTIPVNPQPLPLTKMFAEEAGCETEDTAAMTTCLKGKSPEDLLESFQALQPKIGPMYFSPVVDGTFLTSQPMDLMDKGEINTADYLLGVSNHEFGWLVLPFAIQGDPLVGISQEDFVRLTKTAASMVYRDNPNMDKMVDAMVAEYSAESDDPMAIQYQFSHLCGDFLFVAPTIMEADKHAGAGARVLLYENQYRPSIYPNRPDWVGCDHGDDIFMVMGIPFFDDQGATNITYSKTDEHVSLSLMAYWANFARTGDPSDSTGGPTDSPSLPTWPQYTPDNPVYMKLDVVPTTDVGLKSKKMKLWNEVIPKLAAVKKDELGIPNLDKIVDTIVAEYRDPTTPDDPLAIQYQFSHMQGDSMTLVAKETTPRSRQSPWFSELLTLRQSCTVPNMVAFRVLAAIVTLLLNFCATAGQDDGLVVSTVTGQVRGTTTHTTDLPDKPIYAFLGIPYAAPPVGELRYRPPQPALPWEGVREAVDYGSYCPQNLTMFNKADHDFPMEFGENMTKSEDCLTVNVFTPTVAADAALPVLLWIHGGALKMGMGSPPGWEALAAHQDVVVVSINYRLGVLGFLSTGDENMPGNYGLLDQVRAMEWVKENIRNFGGDPERVTIFGESAGAISVSYHLLSPLSKGLFQRAISQSGTWKTFPVNPQPLAITKMFAEKAGCETEDTATITTCLKEKSAEELVESFDALGQILLTPVVDGTFLTTDPADLMENGDINTVDYLLGINNHEYGWVPLSHVVEGDLRVGIPQEEFVKLVRTGTSMYYYGNPNLDNMVDTIVAEYRHPTTPDDPLSILYQLSQMNGDVVFLGPTMLVAEKHVDAGARVFLYENQYRPSIHPNRPDWVGCDHGDDLFMLWGLPFLNGLNKPLRYTKEDEEFSLIMFAYWANFARTGDPSDSTGGPTDSPSLPTWPQYTPDNPVYMKLDVVPTTDVGLKPDKVKLWNEVIPNMASAGKVECPVVSTETGQVIGTVSHATDLPNKPIYTYLAIPYAAPPVGELRYRPPQTALPWEGVRKAVELGSYCPQNLTYLNAMDFPFIFGVNMTMSEDCLTLSVFTPTVDAALPVLLMIHGGGLTMGMGSMNGYEALSAHQHVVVVSINYRLGVLGFLSTGDENIPGNYGFLDQVRAMEWVKDNIRNFGGDPERVTLFGESAGAVSISYQLMSPLSKGLFQRAISQSGTWTTMPVNPQPLPLTKKFAEEAGCETEDTAAMATCLKGKSPEDLLESFQSLQLKTGTMYFSPVVDGVFLTSQPMDLMQTGNVNTADYLLGVNNHEFGWVMLPLAIQGDPLAGISEEDFVRLTKTATSVVYRDNPNMDKMVDTIVAEYLPKSDDPMAIQYQFSHLYGDFLFVAPTVLVADKHADAGSRIFLYENQYRPSIYPNRPDWVGCDHGDDNFLVMGIPFMDDHGATNITYSKTDEHVSLSMMAYWANFARTGDPGDSTGGPTDSPSLPTWPQYTPDNPVYMKLDVVPTTDVGLKSEKMKLWNEVIPKLAAVKKDEL
ncbi:uncharacterized protein [Branchiostoma lanceolatum]|uniref:uncharacterized protein n=1 Tax=Branchiostoma lanceolatum TaxID=7740 RepID=UPI00345289A7